MRIKELLVEGRDAPLYHFTTVEGFKAIIDSNMLKGHKLLNKFAVDISENPSISFTRDYDRDSIPGQPFTQSLGFRVDQNKLAQTYRLKPVVNNTRSIPSIDQMSDQQKKKIEKMRDTGDYSQGKNIHIDGVSLSDIARGRSDFQRDRRWESEERIEAAAIDNFSNYITGIVVTVNDLQDKEHEQDDQPKDLANYMLGNFRGKAGFETRNAILDAAIKLNVPLIFRRKSLNPKEIKKQIITIANDRKAQLDKQKKENNTMWIVMHNLQGNGVAYTGPEDPKAAAKEALENRPKNFPNGIFGIENMRTGEKYWFDPVYKNIKTEPVISKNTEKKEPATA